MKRRLGVGDYGLETRRWIKDLWRFAGQSIEFVFNKIE
jgi:hypothetical protein